MTGEPQGGGGAAAAVRLQLRLAAARFEAEPFARWVLKFVGTARWHTATQTAAFDAVTGCAHPVGELERCEAVWAASPDPAARWLALRVLASVAAEQGWSDDRRDRLRRYREDASPLVADEAALLFPPDPPAPK